MYDLPLANYRHKYVFSYAACFLRINKSVPGTVRGIGLFALIIYMGGFFCSCSPTKSSTYFQNLKKDTTIRNLVSKNLEPKIQKGDILSISVASLSPDVSLYNGVSASSSGGSSSSSAPTAQAGPSGGYLVDGEGNIDFVKLGMLHAAGMTKKELKDTLETGLVPYLRNVVVTVGFLNRHVTMLGGIAPQILPMTGDNMTILDALAASGDITDKGKTDNILVIREKGDTAKEFKRINLTDNSIFSSPFFFMHPNDIVYVEPKRPKTPITTLQLVSLISSGVSLLILILNTVKL